MKERQQNETPGYIIVFCDRLLWPGEHVAAARRRGRVPQNITSRTNVRGVGSTSRKSATIFKRGAK